MVKERGVRYLRYVLLIVSILALLGSVGVTEASVYSSLIKRSQTPVSSPEVILQNGTAGSSTIYTNSTSAKVSVEAPLFDFVDSNDPDVDSSTDKGQHSNFSAQQVGPDSIYDMLEEENTAAIEDYVDNNSSNVDSLSNIGTHGNFENQKTQDSSYDTLTEESQANTYSLNATGGYMIIGDGTPDWGSVTGTISFWVRMDGSVQGRFYGQNGDMETRWSGTNLILDWGGTDSMTSAYSFSADTWYFVAHVWDENNDNLFLYVGDENNAPTLDSNSLSGTWTSTTPTPTENRFLNGLGGAEPVDGQGDDLRYWNIARNLTEIQSDYNTTLTGSEPNLQSYFKLDNSFNDIGPNNDDGSGSGSYSFSASVPFGGSSDYGLDLEVQWIGVIDFLPTEKLYIYTGTLGSEDLCVDYWNGTGWENLATDLVAYSCNDYAVSLTSTTFTIRFRDGTTVGDTIQDQWQIDASLLRVEGAGDKEDVVDNDTSDEDSSSDLGVLTDFTNMTSYDANMANFTEISGDVDGDWGDTNNPGGTSSAQSTARAMGGTSPDVDNMTLTSISVWWGGTGTGRLAVYQGGAFDNATGATLVWDAGEVAIPLTAGWVTISGGSAPLAKNTPTWLTWKCNDANYYYVTSWDSASDFQSGRGRAQLNDEGAASTDVWDATIGANVFGDFWYDLYINYTFPNYQLDQEVQWTNAPYILPNENLSIYGGSMGTEDIKVDVWNGTDWETVFTDLSSGWNNISITQWLTTSNFTIRFKGGTETGDTSQDTWQIDVALIHIWYDGGENYELDLEVQWTSADYDRTNEELCIETGTFSGSENIQMKVWNSTGSSWHWVMNLTANQWNNMSITPYLTSNTLTVQFLGGTETGDTTQDSWNIDATLLHVWTNESNWLTGWGKRVKITIGHNDIDSDLSDFPILVHLSNSSGRDNDDATFVFDEVGSNSKKIAVTQSNGTTQCYVEIESWNSTSEQAWLWVKVPNISSTANTDLYLYYDSSQSDNTAYVGDKGSTPAQTVWNADFNGVWHLDEDPSGTPPQMKDSTSSNNNGTSNGIMTSGDQITGKIDGSLDFDGTDDYIQTTSNGLKTLDNFTLSVWFKADSTTTAQHMLWEGPASQNGWGDGSNPTSHEMHLTLCKFDANNTLNFFYGYEAPGGDWVPAIEINVSFSDTTNWNHAVVVMTGASTSPSAELFLNGVSQGTDTGTQTNRTAWDTNLRIGRPGTAQRLFDGMIDEVRILETARSVGWIKASYESERDNLLDFGASGPSEGTYDYVFRVNNTATDSWQTRLKSYSDSNISRLDDCTISFYNSTDGASNQIIVEDGSYIQDVGPWFDLGDSETIYIAVAVEASFSGASIIYVYLEILTPSTTTYAQYILVFQFT